MALFCVSVTGCELKPRVPLALPPGLDPLTYQETLASTQSLGELLEVTQTSSEVFTELDERVLDELMGHQFNRSQALKREFEGFFEILKGILTEIGIPHPSGDGASIVWKSLSGYRLLQVPLELCLTKQPAQLRVVYQKGEVQETRVIAQATSENWRDYAVDLDQITAIAPGSTEADLQHGQGSLHLTMADEQATVEASHLLWTRPSYRLRVERIFMQIDLAQSSLLSFDLQGEVARKSDSKKFFGIHAVKAPDQRLEVSLDLRP